MSCQQMASLVLHLAQAVSTTSLDSALFLARADASTGIMTAEMAIVPSLATQGLWLLPTTPSRRTTVNARHPK